MENKIKITMGILIALSLIGIIYAGGTMLEKINNTLTISSGEIDALNRMNIMNFTITEIPTSADEPYKFQLSNGLNKEIEIDKSTDISKVNSELNIKINELLKNIAQIKLNRELRDNQVKEEPKFEETLVEIRR